MREDSPHLDCNFALAAAANAIAISGTAPLASLFPGAVPGAPLLPLRGAPVHEPRSAVSARELRRLLTLGSAGGCVSLSSDGAPLAPLRAAAWSDVDEEGEDPSAGACGAASSDDDVEEEAGALAARSRVAAVACVARGYAVVHATYEDEVRLRVGAHGAFCLELPGPARSSVAFAGGVAELCFAGSLGPVRVQDALPSGLPSGSDDLVHFCVPLILSLSAIAADGTILSSQQIRDDDNKAPRTVQLSLPSQTARLLIRRSYAWSLLNDGHALCIALPTAPAAGEDTSAASVTAAAPLLSLPLRLTCSRARCEAIFFDTDLCGISSVVSPSHTITIWGLGAAHVKVEVELVGLSGRVGEWGSAPAIAAGQANAAVVLLIEPGNMATVWRGLRSSHGSLEPPAGLAALLLEHVRDGGNVTSVPSPMPRVPAAMLPAHIAVIMDGNGRWAESRHLSRSAGHSAGVESIHGIIRSCRRLRIPFLTLYAFSTQNWARPEDEVTALMRLLAHFVRTDLEELCANGVRLLVNGDIARLPKAARVGLERMVASSACNVDGLTLRLALSYGGREEIVGACAAACRAAQAGALDPSSLSPESFRAFLPHPDVPDPDLLIRTSGELRVSNFLLWQIAYTELYATPVLWPDFGDAELAAALVAFAARERRFGKTSAQVGGGGGGEGILSIGCDTTQLCMVRGVRGGAVTSASVASAAASTPLSSIRDSGGATPVACALADVGCSLRELGVSLFLLASSVVGHPPSPRSNSGQHAFFSSAHVGNSSGNGDGGGHSGSSSVDASKCPCLPRASLSRRVCVYVLLILLPFAAALIFIACALLIASLALRLGVATQQLANEGGVAVDATQQACTLVLDSSFWSGATRVLWRALGMA